MPYDKQTWADGDIITDEKLNHIEDGISAIIEMELDDSLSIAGKAADAKAVGNSLELKAEIDGLYEGMTVGNAEQLVSSVYVEDKVPYNFRTAGGSADIGNRLNDKIAGGTIAWNQLANLITQTQTLNGITFTNNGDGSITANGTATANTTVQLVGALPVTSGHKYLFKGCPTGGSSSTYSISTLGTSDYGNGRVIENTASTRYFWITIASGMTVNNLVFRPQIFDLTQMFDTTIADYIYSLEQANAGAGVAWFKKLFSKDYYTYNAGELLSVSGLQSHDMVGFNAYNPTTGTAKLVGGMEYQITGTYTSVSYEDVSGNAETLTIDNDGYFTPSVNGTLTVTGGNATDTCVHLVWDGERDGEYEEYELHSYPLDSSLVLRGIPKLDSNNELYYDGDTYESDGKVTRKYGIVDLGTLDYSYITTSGRNYFRGTLPYSRPTNNTNAICSKYDNGGLKFDSGMATADDKRFYIPYSASEFLYIKDSAYTDATAFKTAMSGVYLVYELATPTEETAEPYVNPQIVDDFGTEEYVTDSIVPVGHETQYQNNLCAKLEMAPNSPDGNGDYIVRQTNGTNEYVPLVIPAELPTMPTEDGTYVLTCTVANGTPTLSWIVTSE